MDQNDLGGLQIPTTTSSDASDNPSIAGSSASAETIKQRKTRSDAGKPRGARAAANAASVPPISQSQFAALYDPKIWSKALAAPGDAMAAMTGKQHWEIGEKEREALGATGSIAAQCFAVSDPRYLALSLCLITLIDVYGVRIAKDMSDRAKEREEQKRRKQRDLHSLSE